MKSAVSLLGVAAATLLFWFVVHEVSGLWLDVALRPEVRQALQKSLEDQKRMRALDAAHGEEYRKQFERTSTLLQPGCSTHLSMPCRMVEQAAAVVAPHEASAAVERSST